MYNWSISMWASIWLIDFRSRVTGRKLMRTLFVGLYWLFWCSLFDVCNFRGCLGAGTYISLCASIWAHTCPSVHRHLLIDGLLICIVLIPHSFFLIRFLSLSASKFISYLHGSLKSSSASFIFSSLICDITSVIFELVFGVVHGTIPKSSGPLSVEVA